MLIRYGVVSTDRGFLPVLHVGSERPRLLNSVASDLDVAKSCARWEALEEDDRYTGDWEIELVDIGIVDLDHCA